MLSIIGYKYKKTLRLCVVKHGHSIDRDWIIQLISCIDGNQLSIGQ